MESVTEQILTMLREKFGGNPESSDPLSDIGVDSVGMAEMTVELESLFNIRVDDGILDVQTIEDLVHYVNQRITNVAVD